MGSKSIFASLTFWSSVVTLVGAFAPRILAYLGSDPQVVASSLVVIAGWAFTVYGRIRAKQPVTYPGGPPASPAKWTDIGTK